MKTATQTVLVLSLPAKSKPGYSSPRYRPCRRVVFLVVVVMVVVVVVMVVVGRSTRWVTT